MAAVERSSRFLQDPYDIEGRQAKRALARDRLRLSKPATVLVLLIVPTFSVVGEVGGWL